MKEMLQQNESITKSRRAILDRLMVMDISSPGLPTPDESMLTHFDDPLGAFVAMLESVGGAVHMLDNPHEATDILNQIDVFASAERVVSLVPEAVQSSFDVSQIKDPHDLSAVDWTIAKGEFAVAENGAIWIDGQAMPHRALLFIAQYLAIVVSRREIVHHMHQAYARIGTPKSPFGVFVSGPSKTADIEQSLVLGAHGCRALQVFLTP
ncbi:Lactate utilization protein C [Planctomycetes bacterium CA13]|uniref:Lactate utilization protein C n=1 Tax=Novipirellula herctigrandis TaxID=2527986 RepID=A0A5C5YPP4_9BACT|nr:Lactate utilization protein C [Planctomycetes bacterium CA13]